MVNDRRGDSDTCSSVRKPDGNHGAKPTETVHYHAPLTHTEETQSKRRGRAAVDSESGSQSDEKERYRGDHAFEPTTDPSYHLLSLLGVKGLCLFVVPSKTADRFRFQGQTATLEGLFDCGCVRSQSAILFFFLAFLFSISRYHTQR